MDELHAVARRIGERRGRPLLIMAPKKIERLMPLDLADCLAGRQFDELDVMLMTGGGDIDAAFVIVKMLRRQSRRVNILLPFYAKSAGTLVCLAADELVVSSVAEVGPLDAQVFERQRGSKLRKKTSALNGYQALDRVHARVSQHFDAALKRLAQEKISSSEMLSHAVEYAAHIATDLYASVDPRSVSEYERVLQIGVRYAVKTLVECKGWDEAAARRVAEMLVYGYPSHEFVIDADELKGFGLPVVHAEAELDALMCKAGKLLHDHPANLFHIIEPGLVVA